MSAALVGFSFLLLLILLRVPIALAMGLVGFFGFNFLQGLSLETLSEHNWTPSLSFSARRVATTALEYSLSVIPLFVLMGNVLARSKVSKEIYDAAHAFLGHRRGGLASATVVACGSFAAICGSSLATAATMSKVAIPEMRKFGYADSLSTAAVAAGGTLGILIPPSVILVIYGIITETSIRELFAAGFLPGLVGILFYLAAVRFTVWRDPMAAPQSAARESWAQRWRKLLGTGGALFLFVLVIGGIYAGIFTPTEAAGIGAGGAILLALVRRSMSRREFQEALGESVRTSSMLFCVIIGALIFSTFINRSGMTDDLTAFISDINFPPLAVLALMLLFYVALGMIFESLSMLLLTIPVFFPVVISLGYDPVWFGIIAVVVTEISLITPPVGLNVFVLSSTLGDTSTTTIFRGVTPFWVADILRLAVLVLFPAIALWLPQLLYH